MVKTFFDYPIDVKSIISKADQIKEGLLSTDCIFLEKKVAILGGSTTSEFVNFLDLFLLANGIKGFFYESDYGKYLEEALFDNDRLKEFNPDIVYIHTTIKNIDTFADFDSTEQEVQSLLSDEIDKYQSIWKALEPLSAIIIQNNFDLPQYRTLGNLDAIDYRGRVYFINQLNFKLHNAVQNAKNVYLNDLNFVSSKVGLTSWYDDRLWHLYKYAASFSGLIYLAKNIQNIVSALFGKAKKNLVLDLDNTLWGGVIGDDGLEKIKIGEDGGSGESFKGFQKELRRLKDSGVLLTIASKNEESNALIGLSHEGGALKPEDFGVIKANWNPKDQNIDEIARELNLGLDSFVFLDDNPAERALVAGSLPSVEVPDIGNDPNNYFKYIDGNGFFERVSLAQEDTDRSKYYNENKKRDDAKTKFQSQDAFLESLQMHGKVSLFDDVYVERVTQLINKTNQFNLTTKRYSLAEVIKIQDDPSFIAFYGKLEDKFGDNGLISVLIANKDIDTIHIDTWLMSCRVLKRGMEFAMFNALLEEAKKLKIMKIVGHFMPTEKNMMVKSLYSDLGFTLTSESDQEDIYTLDVATEMKVKHHIEIIENFTET
ncbi:HAD-IIIC family phosphatase [bacterium]|nr:HAD-IIIC family phosphatase [bacterium]